MSETDAKPESELNNFNWCSKKGYSRLKAAKLSVRKAVIQRRKKKFGVYDSL